MNTFLVFLCYCFTPLGFPFTSFCNISQPTQKILQSPQILEDTSWQGLPHLGQVSGVAVDGDGFLHVFHRGSRVWDGTTFDKNFNLRDKSSGPIPNKTVLVVDPFTGKTVYSWGANKFYMPHGITVDYKGNTWVTDVGLHQVFMFPAREEQPVLTLGEAFTPGAGKSHFCKPTDVAVPRFDYFFVSDGYCNSRILMFDKGGHFLKEIGLKDGMRVPHSLALIPEHDALCAADRENRRILCYSSRLEDRPSDMLLAQLDGEGLGRVFAIDKRGSYLLAINGPDLGESGQSLAASHGLLIDIESGSPKTLWGPDEGFAKPHDLAVSPDGRHVYVSEIDVSAPKRVYKFRIVN